MKPSKVWIYTDGACRGNPGPGGWAFALFTELSGVPVTCSGSAEDATNNMMELEAVVHGISHAHARISTECDIEIITDSKYVADGASKWLNGWIRKGWKTSTGEDVKNQKLWQDITSFQLEHRITWTWVRGHQDNKWNNHCDMLATRAIDELLAKKTAVAA